MIASRFSEKILERLYRGKIFACLTIEEPRHAVPTARALLAGGIDIVELTLRTPKSIESLRRLTAEVPEMLAGVGTILFPDQVYEVVRAGGMFGVAPGLSERIVKTAQDAGLPFAPGITTASELEKGIELGCREMKLFPAEPIGGIAYMKSLWTPYAHLGVRFLPLGGLSPGNIADYLREPSVLAAGGSWIATQERIVAENGSAITAAAREAVRLVQSVR